MDEGPTFNLKALAALLLPLLACAVQWLFWDFLQPYAYILFYPAVYVSARLGGKRIGIAATIISGFLIPYLFIPPLYSFAVTPASRAVSVLAFLGVGILFAYMQDYLQQARCGEVDAREQAQSSEEKLREARIEVLELERRLAEERLHEKEEQFRIMFMESSLGEAQMDPVTGRFLKVNPALCRMAGYREADLLQLGLPEVTRPEDRERCGVTLKSLVGERGGMQAEFSVLRSDGSAVYCQVNMNLARDAEGRPASVLAVIQDVTERRRAEDALLKSEEKFALAFSGNPAAIALTRLEDGVFLDVNETWQTMTGYTREEALGMSGRGLWPDRESARRFVEGLRETGTVRGWEQPFHRKDGETFIAQLWSQLLTVAGEQVILSTLVDITRLKRAEAALQDSETRFRTIFDHAPVAIGIGAVEDGRLLEANPAWLRLMGYRRDEVIDRTATELGIYLEPREREEIVRKARQGEGVSRELQLRRKSGEVIDVLFSADVVVLGGRPCLLVMLNDVTIQKQAERALQKSKQEYQQLFQNMLEGVASCRMVWDASGAAEDFVFLNVNRALLHLSGLPDLTGKRISQVIPQVRETNPELLQACGRVAERGEPEHLETYLAPLEQWYAVSLYGVERGYFVALCDNITARKREEIRKNATLELLRICNEAQRVDELLSRTARFFRDLSCCEAIGIRLRSGDDYPYCETIGLSEAFVDTQRGLCDRGVRDPQGGGALHCLCGEVIFGRCPKEAACTQRGSYWTANGTTEIEGYGKCRCHSYGYRSLALVPLHSHGERIGLFQFSDRRPGLVSAKKVALYEDLVDYIAISFSKLKADQALLEASQYNEQIIAGAQEGIIVYDRELRYQVWNPYMERFTGIKAEEILGLHPRDVLPFLEENGVVEKLARTLEGEESGAVDFPFSIESTGVSGWAVDTRAPLRNAQGEIIGVIATVRDITAERRLEEQLRQAQKMEAVGQLAGGVAHDFNNVLQVIMGYCSLLEVDPKLGEKQKGEVEQIMVSAERAAQLTKGLLAFSRKQVMEPKRVNLCDIVQHVQKFLVRIIGEDITLKTGTCPEGSLTIMADSGHIEQVLINLATNARDAMSRGGTLTLKTESVAIEEGVESPFGHSEPGRYACIVMQDTGCGMDEETRGRIFEPFFTTKEVGKGTGLGMAIVYGIVKQHNGFMTVYSEPGHGTTFRIYLPQLDAGVPAGGDAELPPPRGGSETLLVAEDDAEVRKLLVTVLARFGYRVIEAEDGEEAVALFEAHRADISLVVMDLIMPRKSGAEAGEEITRLDPGVKILYSSGYTSDFMERSGVSEQGIQLIMKPVQPVELLRKVREMLER